MVSTIYQPENAEFSNACHALARQIFYPKMFGVEADQIVYEESTLLADGPRGKILDGELGIDRLLHCNVEGLMGQTVFAVQERFRRHSYSKYRDITVTEWNYASNQPSELSKVNAGIFVYGYANESVTDFIEIVAVNTPSLIHAVTSGNINFKKERNKKHQSFLSFKFIELYRKNAIMYHYPSNWRIRDASIPSSRIERVA